MASGTRSKADSDMKQIIAELRELAAVMYDDEAEQKEFVRAQIDKEMEERRKEKERRHEIAMERKRREIEVAIAKEKEILEIRDSYRPQSLELNSTSARQDQEAEESKTMAHVPTGYTAQTDTEVTAKDEIFMPDTPPLNNTTLSTQPDPPAQSNSLCDAPIQPMPSSKTPPKKAPIQQPATHENCNRPACKPRHNQNEAHRDCNNSTRGDKPNQAYHDCNNSMRSRKSNRNRQKQQAPQTISVMTSVLKPSVTNQQTQTDRTAGDPYVISTLTVAPEPTSLGLTETEVLPLLPQPVSSPPGIETILVNGRYVRSLFDTGCAVSSVICKALVDPADLTDRTVTIQSIDREIPPKVLPIARVHVECKYVHGTIEAVVMESPVYDFILGSRYIPLGVVNKPYFSLPVGRTTKQKGGSNQPVGSPGRHSNKSFTGSSAKLKPRHPGTDTAGKSRGKRNNYTREGPFNSCSSAIKPLIPGTGTARKSQRKVNFHSRESGPHHGSTHTIRPLFPDIDRVWKIRGKPINRTHEETPHYGFRDKPRPTYAHWALRHNVHPTYWSAPRRRCTQSYLPGLFPQVSRIAPSTWQSACGQNIGDSGPLGRTPLWTLATS
ncbi:uncharacterized protein LOC129928244 [Biomphalaria glabrata]|uniref:Uncharacterized protein LOC129928244 n=1 Tax=Biomphalaria glabrata TaxID=6526 RepID=A0A9W3BDZ1_BIOGL|nr:uncharacterized protein LOC129928244 [Biomphalaria glabrata]